VKLLPLLKPKLLLKLKKAPANNPHPGFPDRPKGRSFLFSEMLEGYTENG
jgi:hypothetical protein